MSRVAFLIDGFNLYHALDYSPSDKNPKRYRKYEWLSLSQLAQSYLTIKD